MDQEGSFYTLTPGIVHQDGPAVFGSKDVSPVAAPSFLHLKTLEYTPEVNSVVVGTVS